MQQNCLSHDTSGQGTESSWLLDVCNLDGDLAQMTDLCLGVMDVQHIDEGRLKMKTDCPILTDVALRQKALEVLLSYNPTWLRLGLVVVLGPLALLGDIEMPKICSKGAEEVTSENALLEVLLEQQFLADAVLAKQHARNRYTHIFQKLNE